MSITSLDENSQNARNGFEHLLTPEEDVEPMAVAALLVDPDSQGVRRGRCFIVTWWFDDAFTEKDNLGMVTSKLNEYRQSVSWINVGAWEVAPTTGKKHCHIVFYLRNPVSVAGVRELFWGHWVQIKSTMSTFQQVEDYCNKHGPPQYWYGPVFMVNDNYFGYNPLYLNY